MSIDKYWRPADWSLIKQNILNESPIIFSPSVGYSKDQKDTIMEKVASSLISEILKELVDKMPIAEVMEDARPIHSGEQTSQENGPSVELDWPV